MSETSNASNPVWPDDARDAALLTDAGKTAEQWARDLMELCGWEDAQKCSAGDVVFLANLLAELKRRRAANQGGDEA